MSNKQEFGKLVKSVHEQLSGFDQKGLSMVSSSSFQTQSIPLLHILSQYEKDIEVVFLDTGFLFPETHAFRKQLVKELGLKVRIERSDIPHSQPVSYTH